MQTDRESTTSECATATAERRGNMTLEEHIQALITQYQRMQQRHKMRADNAYYQFQSEMWQAMSDDYAIMVEDLQQALENAEDVHHGKH